MPHGDGFAMAAAAALYRSIDKTLFKARGDATSRLQGQAAVYMAPCWGRRPTTTPARPFLCIPHSRSTVLFCDARGNDTRRVVLVGCPTHLYLLLVFRLFCIIAAGAGLFAVDDAAKQVAGRGQVFFPDATGAEQTIRLVRSCHPTCGSTHIRPTVSLCVKVM